MMRTFLLALLLTIGCRSSATEPTEPVWGKQACAHCLMLLSTRESAAQAQLTDGSHIFFDDIGCLIEWQSRTAEPVRGSWVRSPRGQGWADAASARYSTGHSTPMDYGLLPAEQGLSFEEAQVLVREHAAKRSEAHP